ncbi:hypothetical protein LSH36_8g03023 [Paralvinella palmiformis]|uniref:Uncharacterized protein n=1 Tax=Paralvinella palmiformis TaxID=53620 RepID=A0AAD9KFM8_9ANNE|nr:hypothetical protein LSH36_8g03023 [Paralvinella palmiformis]
MDDVNAGETTGRMSPACTRIPRVKSQPASVTQKPPRSGSNVIKAQPTRRSSSSAPNSRCSSPLLKQGVVHAHTAKMVSPVTTRQAPSSPSSIKRLTGSPALGRRPPGSPLIKRSSPAASPSSRRKSLPKAAVSSDHQSSDHPSTATKTPMSPSKLSRPVNTTAKTESRTSESQLGVKRVPTPMVQRRDMGSYTDLPRNRSPIVSLTNRPLDDEIDVINKCTEDIARGSVDVCDNESLINNGNNKENRYSTSASLKTNPKIATGLTTSMPKQDSTDNKLLHDREHNELLNAETHSAKFPKDHSVLRNVNNKPACDSPEDLPNQHWNMVTSLNQNLQQDVFLLGDDCVEIVENQGRGHNRSRSMGLMSTSLDSFNLGEKMGNRFMRTNMGRSLDLGQASFDVSSDDNMNQCVTSVLRTSCGHRTPVSSAVTTPSQCTLSKSSISLSLPVLSNGHYVHTKLFGTESPFHHNNNNNITKSFLSSSALTDVIPKNAGEELSTAKLDDGSLFVSGQNGIPVILPDALELGGQALCENCDEVKSPISPIADLVSPDGSPAKTAPYENGFLYANIESLSKKSRSCPNLLFKEPRQLALKPEAFLNSDDFYEKYPPIRHLDVNQLEYYREEQLREYYHYLQEQQAQWIQQGLISPE